VAPINCYSELNYPIT